MACGLSVGKARLAEMNRTATRNYFTALEESVRSANSIHQAKVVLAALFCMAVSDKYLDVNPFHDVKTPGCQARARSRSPPRTST